MNSSELQKLFSTNLKTARNMAHLSQMKLAEKANLSVGYICDLESGRRWGTPETFTRLATALEIEPYVLLLPYSIKDDSLNEEKIKHLYLNQLSNNLRENINKAVSKAISDTLKTSKVDEKNSKK